jgi:hypothetical protein
MDRADDEWHAAAPKGNPHAAKTDKKPQTTNRVPSSPRLSKVDPQKLTARQRLEQKLKGKRKKM